jgi:hypothetical protein
MLACFMGYLDIATMLLDRGADIHARNMVSLRRERKEGKETLECFERGLPTKKEVCPVRKNSSKERSSVMIALLVFFLS